MKVSGSDVHIVNNSVWHWCLNRWNSGYCSKKDIFFCDICNIKIPKFLLIGFNIKYDTNFDNNKEKRCILNTFFRTTNEIVENAKFKLKL